MKILGIVGSKRKKGNTSCLVQAALKSAEKEESETELIFLGDYCYLTVTTVKVSQKLLNC